MSEPFLYPLEFLRSLAGKPAVSFPYADTAYPVTERVEKVPLNLAVKAYGLGEPDTTRFPLLALVAQRELSRDAQYAEVYRRYERLPGKVIFESGHDEEIGCDVITYRQKRAVGSLDLTAPGDSYDPLSLLSAKVIRAQFVGDDALVGTRVVTVLPSSISGFRVALNGSEPMPDVVTILGGWSYDSACRFQPPFEGVHYLLEHHVPASPIFCDVAYTWGKNTSPAIEDIALWKVTSSESRIGLPIGRNTLHDDYVAAETGDCTWDVEDMAESTPAPSAYITGDEYVFNVTEQPVRGGPEGLWERRTYSFIAT